MWLKESLTCAGLEPAQACKSPIGVLTCTSWRHGSTDRELITAQVQDADYPHTPLTPHSGRSVIGTAEIDASSASDGELPVLCPSATKASSIPDLPAGSAAAFSDYTAQEAALPSQSAVSSTVETDVDSDAQEPVDFTTACQLLFLPQVHILHLVHAGRFETATCKCALHMGLWIGWLSSCRAMSKVIDAWSSAEGSSWPLM